MYTYIHIHIPEWIEVVEAVEARTEVSDLKAALCDFCNAQVYGHGYIRIRTCVCTYIHTYTYICMYIYIYIHVYMYVFVHL